MTLFINLHSNILILRMSLKTRWSRLWRRRQKRSSKYTEYRIHWIQNTLNTEDTEYRRYRIQNTLFTLNIKHTVYRIHCISLYRDLVPQLLRDQLGRDRSLGHRGHASSTWRPFVVHLHLLRGDIINLKAKCGVVEWKSSSLSHPNNL